jgi:AmiR/NasT family two-component response regulator
MPYDDVSQPAQTELEPPLSNQTSGAELLGENSRLRADLAAATELAENLRHAQFSNRRIGAAIGILMASRKITEEQAFDLLRQASQHTHLKLRDLAEEVIHTGELEE